MVRPSDYLLRTDTEHHSQQHVAQHCYVWILSQLRGPKPNSRIMIFFLSFLLFSVWTGINKRMSLQSNKRKWHWMRKKKFYISFIISTNNTALSILQCRTSGTLSWQNIQRSGSNNSTLEFSWFKKERDEKSEYKINFPVLLSTQKPALILLLHSSPTYLQNLCNALLLPINPVFSKD